ncbi:MAG: hypothetical protein IK041_02330 [Bacteroidales bacterium]|nr:hypothetical protein [Bacteroidales bacterium]
MNRVISYFVLFVASLFILFVLVWLVLIPIHIVLDYNIDPYIRNLSDKDSSFIKTASYFMTLIPSRYKETHELIYERSGKRKRTFYLRASSTDKESILLENISYNSAEAKGFLLYVGITKEQLDTLDSYLNHINCNSIRQLGKRYGYPNVELKMDPKDICSYFYHDSISISRHYSYDSTTNQEICDSLIVKKGPHILIR